MQTIITADQCRTARRELGLSQADVANAVGINRQYVSEFETGYSNRITAAQLRKLRAFYESKIQEAIADGEEIALTFGEPDTPEENQKTATSPTPLQAAAAAPYRFWPVYLEVDQPIAIKVLGMMQDNDARIAVLLQQSAEKDDGFLGDGEFTEGTKDALQETFSLLSLNYALLRSLSGWPALGLTPSAEDPQTLRDVIFSTFQAQFEEAGLILNQDLDEEAEA